ncbi:hypothetical protein ACET3Z_005881 [Daucus carota]
MGPSDDVISILTGSVVLQIGTFSFRTLRRLLFSGGAWAWETSRTRDAGSALDGSPLAGKLESAEEMSMTVGDSSVRERKQLRREGDVSRLRIKIRSKRPWEFVEK